MNFAEVCTKLEVDKKNLAKTAAGHAVEKKVSPAQAAAAESTSVVTSTKVNKRCMGAADAQSIIDLTGPDVSDLTLR